MPSPVPSIATPAPALRHLLLATITLLGACATPPDLHLEGDALVASGSLAARIPRPEADWRPAPVDRREETFDGHPFAIARSAWLGEDALVLVHAERVLDDSGAAHYEELPPFTLAGVIWRSRLLCAPLSPAEVAEESDLRYLARHGFDPLPALRLRQLFRTTETHDAELVVSYGERVQVCNEDPDALAAFDRRLRRRLAGTRAETPGEPPE
jgi:hypothetical protein